MILKLPKSGGGIPRMIQYIYSENNNNMRQEQFTTKQQAVITALSNQHLTSAELLNKAEKVPHILKLYTILDELRSKGIVESYIKKGIKYHYAA